LFSSSALYEPKALGVCEMRVQMRPNCVFPNLIRPWLINQDKAREVLCHVIRQRRSSIMSSNPKDQRWYSIAEQASKEMDGAKLSLLVQQLCSALDERSNKPGASVSEWGN
jgi:hypothetical protein